MVGLGCLRKQNSKQLDSVVSASAPAWVPSPTSSNSLWSGPGSQIDPSLPICFLLCLSARENKFRQKLVPVSGVLLWRAWPCCVREDYARPLELWAGEPVECLGLNGCSVRAWKIRVLRAGRRGSPAGEDSKGARILWGPFVWYGTEESNQLWLTEKKHHWRESFALLG